MKRPMGLNIATIPSQMKRHIASLCWPPVYSLLSLQTAGLVSESVRWTANHSTEIHTSLRGISQQQSSRKSQYFQLL